MLKCSVRLVFFHYSGHFVFSCLQKCNTSVCVHTSVKLALLSCCLFNVILSHVGCVTAQCQGRCSRCQMICVDQRTGKRTVEPLRSLTAMPCRNVSTLCSPKSLVTHVMSVFICLNVCLLVSVCLSVCISTTVCQCVHELHDNVVFTVRLRSRHTVLLSRFCLSVCPSICLSNACIVTKRKHLTKKVQL